MIAVSKVFSVLLMVVVPGGLLVAAAFVLARLVAQQMRHEEGPQGHRLARAMASIHWRDIVKETKRLL